MHVDERLADGAKVHASAWSASASREQVRVNHIHGKLLLRVIPLKV